MNEEQPKFAAVCFDCDGTLTRIEGIDELARRSGRDSEIAPLTTAAMDGTLSIEDVYAKRLEIVRPDREDLEWLGERYLAELVEGTIATVAALHRLEKPVYVVSGGLLQPVTRLAEALGIAATNVRAVEVHLDGEGGYMGFDTNSPLVRSDGKAEICRELAARHGPSIAIVGDGVTDLAARSSGACVVGFGGVAHREVMAEGADFFIGDANLTATLEVLLTDTEFRRASQLAQRR